MNNPIYTVLALFGKSGAGKDTILKASCAAHPDTLHPIVSCTTRPPREGEVDGVDYHFLTPDDFTTKALKGEMLEVSRFRDWFYGTELSTLSADKINIGVFNITGINSLLENPSLNVIPIEIYCDDKVRLIRCLNRETKPDCSEICRRFFTDKEDFAHLNFYYGVVMSEECNSNDIYECQSYPRYMLNDLLRPDAKG